MLHGDISTTTRLLNDQTFTEIRDLELVRTFNNPTNFLN